MINISRQTVSTFLFDICSQDEYLKRLFNHIHNQFISSHSKRCDSLSPPRAAANFSGEQFSLNY